MSAIRRTGGLIVAYLCFAARLSRAGAQEGFDSLAEQGDAKAMVTLGLWSFEGYGGQSDYEQDDRGLVFTLYIAG
jgi:hypothetical protein